jgi:hypothetical protein
MDSWSRLLDGNIIPAATLALSVAIYANLFSKLRSSLRGRPWRRSSASAIGLIECCSRGDSGLIVTMLVTLNSRDGVL